MSGRWTRRWWTVPAAVVALGALVAGPVEGGAPPSDEGGDALDSESPADETDPAGPPSETTDVAIRVEVQQILTIDERQSFFEVDAILTAQWVDKRRPEACTDQIYAGEGAEDALKSDVWAPGFVVVDGRGPRTTTALELIVTCDGKRQYEERFTVAVTQRLTNLNDFPFDAHVIRFEVAPFGETGRRAIRFQSLGPSCETDEEQGRASKMADKYEAEEWEFSAEPCLLVNPTSTTAPPSLTTQIWIDRESAYYVVNVIAPLVLIVIISWVVFWMKPVLHERLGVSLTALLTIIAFDFLTGGSLPKLSFTTRLDQFYNASYLFVALTILVTCLAVWQARKAGRAENAENDETGDDETGDDGAGANAENGPPVAHGAEGSSAQVLPAAAGDGGDGTGTPRTVDRAARWIIPPLYVLALMLTLWAGVFSPGRQEIKSEAVAAEQMIEERAPAGQEAQEAAGEVEAAKRGVDEQSGDGGENDATQDNGTENDATDDDRPEELAAGDSTDGTITASEPRREYVICSEMENALEITMRRSTTAGGTLDPVLDLFTTGDETTLRASDDDGAGGLDSRLVLPPEDPIQCFVLVAGDVSGGGEGTYTLTVERIESVDESDDTDVVEEVADPEATFGVPFDELRDGAIPIEPSVPLDESINEARGVRSFRVCSQGDPGGYVLVRRPSALVDDVFDPVAALYSDNGSLVADDDDGAGGLDSLVALPSGDADSCFVLVVADYSRLDSGKFVVELRSGIPPSAEELAIEQAAAGLLFGRSFDEVGNEAEEVTTDSVERDGRIDGERPLRAYRWCATPEAPAAVVMQVEGADGQRLDPLLVLYTEDGSLRGFDDDSAGGRGSRLELPAGEECFVIVARDLTGVATGSFTVTVAGVTPDS